MPAAAAESVHALTSAIRTNAPVSLSIEDRMITLPAELARALVELLEVISEGRDLTSASAGIPLGTEVASDLLGVSCPWLTTLLGRGDCDSRFG